MDGARLESLHTALSDLVKLYQFRSRDEKLYYGVTVAQAYCLHALWLGGELSMSELARQVTVPVSTMTGVVDQLLARKLVLRRADARDRRSLRVRLSAAGRRLYGASLAEFHARLGSVAEHFTPAELDTVQRFLADFSRMVADWRAIDVDLAAAPSAAASEGSP